MRFVVALALLASLGSVGAQVPDHLKCYKVKDSAVKALYTADLGGPAAEPGCQIKVPGTMLCVETEKQNITPTPPGGGPAPASAGRFVCYKLKCPKAVLAPITVSDQFGTRAVEPKTPKMLCAPEGTSTTTTSTMDTTTTSTTSTSNTTTTSTSTTTLPDCNVIAGACWYLGALAASCDDTCAAESRVYDDATRTFAGSDGTDANCSGVMSVFGIVDDVFPFTPGPGLGCWYSSLDGVIRSLAPSTSSAANANARRACACSLVTIPTTTTTSTTTTSTTSAPTTTLPDCNFIAGACWYLGASGATCDDTCAAQGKVYDDATRTFAGSDGTNSNCIGVLSVFGSFSFNGASPLGSALGCAVYVEMDAYRDTTFTQPESGLSDWRRACACSVSSVPTTTTTTTSTATTTLLPCEASGPPVCGGACSVPGSFCTHNAFFNTCECVNP
jgi:hypothetical protein